MTRSDKSSITRTCLPDYLVLSFHGKTSHKNYKKKEPRCGKIGLSPQSAQANQGQKFAFMVFYF